MNILEVPIKLKSHMFIRCIVYFNSLSAGMFRIISQLARVYLPIQRPFHSRLFPWILSHSNLSFFKSFLTRILPSSNPLSNPSFKSFLTQILSSSNPFLLKSFLLQILSQILPSNPLPLKSFLLQILSYSNPSFFKSSLKSFLQILYHSNPFFFKSFLTQILPSSNPLSNPSFKSFTTQILSSSNPFSLKSFLLQILSHSDLQLFFKSPEHFGYDRFQPRKSSNYARVLNFFFFGELVVWLIPSLSLVECILYVVYHIIFLMSVRSWSLNCSRGNRSIIEGHKLVARTNNFCILEDHSACQHKFCFLHCIDVWMNFYWTRYSHVLFI